MPQRQLTFGSLFAGIGGLDLGLERAGLECVWQVEKEPYAARVLEKHWPKVRRWDDVCTFPPEPVRDWACDLICGGFPCQDISTANKTGVGIDGKKSSLFYQAIRTIEILRPQFVLLENVRTIRSRGLDTVAKELAQIGYDCEWHCVSAAYAGASHIRERCFILAYAKGFRYWPQPMENTGGNGCQQLWPQPVLSGLQGKRRYEWEAEPSVGRVAYGVSCRVDRLRCLGDAVVPQVAEMVGIALLEALRYEDRQERVNP